MQNVKSRIANLEVKIVRKQTKLQNCISGVHTCTEGQVKSAQSYIQRKIEELNETSAELIGLEKQGEYREVILKGKPALLFFTHAYIPYLTPAPVAPVAPVTPVTPVTPVVVSPPPAEPVHQATNAVPREPEGPKYGIDLQDLDNTIAHHTQELQRNDLSAKSRAMAERIIAESKATKDLFAANPSLFLAPDPAMMETQAGVATLMLRGLDLQVRTLDLALEKGYLSPQAYQTAMKELDAQTGTPEQAATEAQELGLPAAFVSQAIALKAEIAAKATGKVTKDKNGTLIIKKKPNYLLWGLGALVLYRVVR
tara:strand:+ start:875 stop:1807 length:933 start_codon:yes stop_codon:yes gene_type:complete